MSFDATMFKDLDKSFRSKVKTVNGDLVDVKGKGTVEIKTFAGIKLIANVLYVPELVKN